MTYVIAASDNLSGLGTSPLNGRTLNNALGGDISLAFFPMDSQGTGAGQSGETGWAWINQYGATAVSHASLRAIRVRLKPAAGGGYSSIIIPGFADSGHAHNSRRIQLRVGSGHTTLVLEEYTTSYQTRASKTITPVPDPIWAELDASAGLTVYARIFADDGVTLLHEISHTFAALPTGTIWGFGGFWNGSNTRTGSVIVGRAEAETPPEVDDVSGVSTGSTTSQVSFTTDTAGGNARLLVSTSDPTAETIQATGQIVPITAAGTYTATVTGLIAGTAGQKAHVVHTTVLGTPSAVARSAPWNQQAALPAPDTTVVTTVGTHTVGGVDHLAIILTGVATNTASVSASMPAAVPPNGATTLPAQITTPDGGGNWIIRFLDPPAGDYDFASILLSNIDHPTVAKSGEKKVQIIPIGGEAPGPGGDAEEDTEAPVMSGPLTRNSLTSTSYTITGYSATDNVGVAGFEYSLNGGTTYAPITTGSSFPVTGRTPGATDQVRVRAFDFADNKATPLSLAVTLAAGDTTGPVMQGVIGVTNKTHNSYTLLWDAAIDDIGVTGYEYSLNGGTNYTNNNTSRIVNVTGRTPSSTDEIRIRGYDAAGNRGAPLSLPVTLNATPVAPTAVISSFEKLGRNVIRIEGTTAGVPLTGTLLLEAGSTPNGAVTQSATITLGNDTFTVTMAVNNSGSYEAPKLTFQNANGSVDVFGTETVTIDPPPPPNPGGTLHVSKAWYFGMLVLTGN